LSAKKKSIWSVNVHVIYSLGPLLILSIQFSKVAAVADAFSLWDDQQKSTGQEVTFYQLSSRSLIIYWLVKKVDKKLLKSKLILYLHFCWQKLYKPSLECSCSLFFLKNVNASLILEKEIKEKKRQQKEGNNWISLFLSPLFSIKQAFQKQKTKTS